MEAAEGPNSGGSAALGELSFGLSAAELRERGTARMERARRELEALAVRSVAPTVPEFLAPLDALLREVRDAGSHGSLVFAVHPDEATRTAGRELSEAADRFFHNFRLDTRAYAALRALDLAGTDDATRFAVEKMVRELRRAGVEKGPDARRRLLELNDEIDRVANKFSENIAKMDRSIELDSPARLSGLPPDFVAAHAPDRDGVVRLTTRYTDFGPVMAYADEADVRRRLLYEFTNRAYPDNMPVLRELLARRAELARDLGYPNYAAYALEDKMVTSPAEVHRLIDRLRDLVAEPARADLDRFLARKRQDVPSADRLEPWEAQFLGPGYYDQKLRTEEFGVDMRAVRAYLPYGRVRQGLFDLCGELFGLAFTPVDVELWHPSVEAYDVRRAGKELGRIYLDLVPREGKYNHAACFTVRDGDPGRFLPQAALVCNFLEPGPSRELVRIEYPQLVTFFHEFGHLLHAVLSGHQRWVYNSQSNLEWDFIEAPSLLFEEWARDPSTLRRFATDPTTGEPIPDDLLRRLKGSSALGRALGWQRQVALAAVALELYEREPGGQDPSDVARSAHDRYAPAPMPPEYHPAASFGHLTGYSACYYTYSWSLVIARDLLRPFAERGSLLDRELAERYATEILMPGSTRPAADLVRTYLGRDFNFEAFDRWVTERPSHDTTSYRPAPPTETLAAPLANAGARAAEVPTAALSRGND